MGPSVTYCRAGVTGYTAAAQQYYVLRDPMMVKASTPICAALSVWYDEAGAGQNRHGRRRRFPFHFGPRGPMKVIDSNLRHRAHPCSRRPVIGAAWLPPVLPTGKSLLASSRTGTQEGALLHGQDCSHACSSSARRKFVYGIRAVAYGSRPSTRLSKRLADQHRQLRAGWK